MTTASRVSDSRVTDEMVKAALKVHYQAVYKRIFASPNAIPDPASDMRAALEAAIACQGPVVKVSDLEALRDAWKYEPTYYVDALTTLIAKAEKV